MKYYYDFKVTGYCSVCVDAKNEEEAKRLAQDEISNKDFGALENIDSEIEF